MAEENETTKRARELVERDREVRERSAREYAERSKGKPTPTQEENDIAAHGGQILEHEDDGSGPDPFDPKQQHERHSEARRPGGGYQTRQATPQSPQPQHRERDRTS